MISEIKKKYKSTLIYIYLRTFRYRKYIKSKKNPIIRKKIVILNKETTIETILQSNKNLVRFGDGEFSLINSVCTTRFQDVDHHLSKRLYEILNTSKDNIDIALPYNLVNLDYKMTTVSKFWSRYVKKNGNKLADLIPNSRIYLDADVTRIYHTTYKKSIVKPQFDKIKRLWDNRDILFVEGAYSRNGVGNDLYDNAKSISRLICPAKNAFDKYEIILDKVQKYGKDKLVLISLGPTATVLAYDLADYGIWALDMGHLDIEYMWYKMNAKEKIKIKGRFINEVDKKIEQDLELNIEDLETYNNSIIEVIN